MDPAAAQRYRAVMSPITIAGVEIPNRVVRTAHATGLAMGGVGDDFVEYHAAPAKSGVGLTIFEAAAVHPNSIGRFRFDDDSNLGEYERAIRRLRKYPMKLFQQFNHVGRAFMTPNGDPPWSSSSIPSPRIAGSELSQRPIAITHTQIHDIVEHFARAAVRVVSAGIDGIEINAAHGYLIAQFLSPMVNRRDDEYGGSRENRARLLVEILTRMRDAIDRAVPVGVRMSADEMYPGGITPDEALELARIVADGGLADFVSVSLGSPMNVTKVIGGMEEPLGYELPWTGPVTSRLTVPTLVAGRITSLAQAEAIVRDGVADLVSMVRAHVADPELVAKSLAGQAHRVRPCIGCNQGCVGSGSSPYGRFGCTVNPTAGFEAVTNTHRGGPASVLVVGGGPAGLEAARAAAASGDRVILCEQADRLGGQLLVARQAPFRSRMGDIADWLAAELPAVGVDIRLGTRVDAGYVRAQRVDRVIVATGSVPRADGFTIADPDRLIPGIGQPHVRSSWDAITDTAIRDARAVVYDDIGHHEAVSVAEALMARGCEVVFVSRLNRVMPLLEAARMETTVKRRLYSGPFEFIGDSRIARIGPGEVTVASMYGAPDRTVEAGLVVVVGGNEPQRRLADELAGELDVSLVGDALGPRFLQLAILEGHQAAVSPGALPSSSRVF